MDYTLVAALLSLLPLMLVLKGVQKVTQKRVGSWKTIGAIWLFLTIAAWVILHDLPGASRDTATGHPVQAAPKAAHHKRHAAKQEHSTPATPTASQPMVSRIGHYVFDPVTNHLTYWSHR